MKVLIKDLIEEIRKAWQKQDFEKGEFSQKVFYTESRGCEGLIVMIMHFEMLKRAIGIEDVG